MTPPLDPQVRELIAEMRQQAQHNIRWSVAGALEHFAGRLDALLTRPVPQPDEKVDIYTPMLWASMSDDQRYAEYIRVRALAASRPDGETQ